MDTVYYLYKKPIVEKKIKYKNGREHGKAKYYDSFGAKQAVIRYKNGQKHGKYWLRKVFNQFDKTSTTLYNGEYVNGQIKNETVTYYEGGRKTGEQQTTKDFQSY